MYKHGKLDVSASYGYWWGGAGTYQGQDIDAATGKQVKSFIDSPYKNIWGLNANMNFNRWNVFGEWLTAPAYSFYNQHYVDTKGVAHVRNGYKGFVANVNYVPYKNVSIGAYYGFANKDMDGNHLGDYWRTDVNFMF